MCGRGSRNTGDALTATDRPSVLLFARRPRLGRVKTRLVPPLSPARALELYRAFLADQFDFLRGFRAEAEVACWVDEPGSMDEFPPDMRRGLQGPGSLGERMLRAFETIAADGSPATVIVGVDSPTLPAAIVRQAIASLDAGADAVVAPADDGGYVLIGMARPHRSLFENIAWGGPGVLEQTRHGARQTGLDLREIAGWYDVDDHRSLDRLREELREERARARAPATAACLDAWTPS